MITANNNVKRSMLLSQCQSASTRLLKMS